MGRWKLILNYPSEHIITQTTAESSSGSVLCGQVSFSNAPLQSGIHLRPARFGRLKQGNETKDSTAAMRLLGELGFMGSRKEQRREELNYEIAEKLSGCFISPPRTPVGSRTIECDFELPIPLSLPATAALPSVEISYAIFASCTLPNGNILLSSRDLRIIRHNDESIHLEPSRTISFPESPLAVRASFDAPNLDSKNIVIPTKLQLQGLNLASTSSMRMNETRWLVPREIRWEFEETAVLITGFPDTTGNLSMATTQRALKKRKLSTGKEKLKLNYPFSRKGNTPIRVLPDGSGMEIPFFVTAPNCISLSGSTVLSVAGGHILHTVLCSEPSSNPALPRKRFAVYLEYKLHIWLRIGEDVFDEASGGLVNRKMDEMAYTILCPLSKQSAAQSQDDGVEPSSLIPPSYDNVREQQPPPGYTTFSGALYEPDPDLSTIKSINSQLLA